MPKKSAAKSASSKKANAKAEAPKGKRAAPKRKTTTAMRKSAKVASGSPIGDALEPVVHRDAAFGTLRLNREGKRFEGETTFRKTTMTVAFDVPSIDELKELIEVAKPLWKRREEWFANWRDRVREYYMQELAANWWEEDYELTPTIFDRLLGWPVAVSFFREEGDLRYFLGGGSEELFSDHGIEAHGSTVDDVKANF